MVGLLVFGRLFFYWIETNHLANETARWAVVDNNPYNATCPGGPYTGLAGCQSLQQHARSSATNEFEDNVVVCVQAFHPDTGAVWRRRRQGRLSDQGQGSGPGRVRGFLRLRRDHDPGAATLRLENIRDGVNLSAVSDSENIGTCA